MYHPSSAIASELLAEGKRVPVYREILADMETPVSAFRKIARGAYSFLLESVVGGERLGRYSFLGTEPYRVVELDRGSVRGSSAGGSTARAFSDPLEVIRQELEDAPTERLPGLPRFQGGAVGYLGYEVARYFERLPQPADNPLGLPEAMLMLADTLLIFDHVEHKIKVVSHAWPGSDPTAAYAGAVTRIDALINRLANGRVRGRFRSSHRPLQATVTSNTSKEAYLARVQCAKRYIQAGDIIQVVPSQRLSRPLQTDPFNVYRALRAVNPSPYMYYLQFGNAHIAGASPEMLVRVEDGVVTSHPIAGTRRRGKSTEEDSALAADLRGDEKECAEHVMLVDLSRNDVGRVSAPGTVSTPRLMDVERYSHVMHLVSEVTGQLRPGLTSYDALRACFPAGTVTGAPKIRAMEIIAELEPHRRGPYAGAVGYFDYSGNLDTAITIRTVVVKDGVAYAQAGGGVVADSDPEREYEETLNKAAAVLKALELAETI